MRSSSWQRWWLLLAGGVAAASICSPAFAGEPRTHDGLYIRGGLGLGWYFDSVESEEFSFANFRGASGSIQGLSVATEFTAGYTVIDGLVVGGGLFHHYIPAPSTSKPQLQGEEVDVDYEWGSSMLWMIGPMVDYYFDPAEGLHAQAGVGLGILDLGEGEPDPAGFPVLPEQGGTGVMFMGGIGHEWWVSDDVSVGGLGRVLFGMGSDEDASGVLWDHVVVVPSLLFTATYN